MLIEGQIIRVLREAEAGRKKADVARRHGVSAAALYNWKSLMPSALGRRKMRTGGSRLLVDAMLDNAGLKDLLSKKW